MQTSQIPQISKMPLADAMPTDYQRPSRITAFEQDVIASQVPELCTNGSIDAGNGELFDQLIDSTVTSAHFDLEIEHALRHSSLVLLEGRNYGEQIRIETQIADARQQLAKIEQQLAQKQRLLNALETKRSAATLRKAQKKAQKAGEKNGISKSFYS